MHAHEARRDAHINRLRQIAHNIGLFWVVCTLLILVALTAYIFAQHPALLGEGRGWLILSLASAFGVWFLVGRQWYSHGSDDSYHRELMRGELPVLPPRTLAYCALLFAMSLALTALNANFGVLLYAVYGVAIGIFALPWAVVPLIPIVFAIFVEFGWLPQQPTADAWLGFVLSVLAFCIYTAIGYVPFYILKGRFERERVFSELERSHEALAVAHRELEEAAGRDRELAVLRERERLAREMHDTLGHALVLANVKLEAALRLRAVDPARADHEIAATQEVLRTSMGELRGSLANLRGAERCAEPLSETLARHAREAAARAGWELKTAFASETDDLAGPLREALLRVGAEAITNAERHANARSVVLSLDYEDGDVVLRVVDDGMGLEPALLPSLPGGKSAGTETAPRSPAGHYGITGMVERIEARGGTLMIRPRAEGRGTHVEARAPLRA